MSSISTNENQIPYILQVSHIKNIDAAALIDFGRPVLIKNLSDKIVLLEVILADGSTVTTTMYPGWNPELVYGVKNVVANTLQYGH